LTKATQSFVDLSAAFVTRDVVGDEVEHEIMKDEL
jgi:hypothetical protein